MATPYKIHIEQSILDDLSKRLSLTRWTDELKNTGWELGTDKEWLQQLCAYWQTGFDWRKQEAQLNTFSHYQATINGTGIHFIHQKSNAPNAIPLLLTHGFPDSFFRFIKLIPLLTAPGEHGYAFDVVVPSIPGYGFSEIPSGKGMNPRHIAKIFNGLMTGELGYEKYLAHGGDWGSSITEQIALYHSDSLFGIHLTDVPFGHGMTPPDNLSKAEEKFHKKTAIWVQTEGAYASVQSTKPQSLAYGLNDSPVGMAGWIIDKFHAWSDNNGNIENAFTKDELLTNLTIYWVTQTINAAMRLYYEAIQAIMQAKYNPLVKLNPFDKTGKKTMAPAAFALFPKDISKPPREHAERFFNVQRWTEMPEGGHFAALEQPQLLAGDIKQFAMELNLVK
ncbi:MAG TPA: epoxide hydrolase [Chitinophagaceae bacterium]|nr:epoxide hydrolase [Chitinophagaceae bacterium]